MASYVMAVEKLLRSAHDLIPDVEHLFDWIGGHQIAEQSVAEAFLELAIRRGVLEATKRMQRALNSLLPAHARLAITGCPGLRMIDAINQAMPSELLTALEKETPCQS